MSATGYTAQERREVLRMAGRELRTCLMDYMDEKDKINDDQYNQGSVLNAVRATRKNLLAAMRRVTDLVITDVKTCYGMK